MTKLDYCHSLSENEILNKQNLEFTLYELYIYGSKIQCLKISKRIMCSIKKLPIRLKVHYIYDTQKAIERGIRSDPSVILNNKIIIEGLIQAEEIEKIFLNI